MPPTANSYTEHNPVRGCICIAFAIAGLSLAGALIALGRADGISIAVIIIVSLIVFVASMSNFRKIIITCDTEHFKIGNLPIVDLCYYDLIVITRSPYDSSDVAVVFLDSKSNTGTGFRPTKINLSKSGLRWVLSNLESIAPVVTSDDDPSLVTAISEAFYERNYDEFTITHLHGP